MARLMETAMRRDPESRYKETTGRVARELPITNTGPEGGKQITNGTLNPQLRQGETTSPDELDDLTADRIERWRPAFRHGHHVSWWEERGQLFDLAIGTDDGLAAAESERVQAFRNELDALATIVADGDDGGERGGDDVAQDGGGRKSPVHALIVERGMVERGHGLLLHPLWVDEVSRRGQPGVSEFGWAEDSGDDAEGSDGG